MMKTFSFSKGFSAAAIALMASLAGCMSAPAPIESFAPVPPVQPQLAPATAGAIYQAGADRRLFEDLKAGRIGDVLTVRLIEQTAAATSSNTATSRSTSAELAVPTILGQTPTWKGNPLFNGSIDGSSDFEGAGSSTQSNSLVGDITVTVVEEYPNGNLLIRGEKWVSLNQGQEFIQLSGVIRPYDINPDNSVVSTRIADAQIKYSGKGVLAQANRKGVFARFFDSMFSGY
jgi:flagellar L-ring protein precursor FlgH